MGLGMEAPDYQVEAHFEALDEGILLAASKTTGYFFPFQFPLKCGAIDRLLPVLGLLRSGTYCIPGPLQEWSRPFIFYSMEYNRCCRPIQFQCYHSTPVSSSSLKFPALEWVGNDIWRQKLLFKFCFYWGILIALGSENLPEWPRGMEWITTRRDFLINVWYKWSNLHIVVKPKTDTTQAGIRDRPKMALYYYFI